MAAKNNIKKKVGSNTKNKTAAPKKVKAASRGKKDVKKTGNSSPESAKSAKAKAPEVKTPKAPKAKALKEQNLKKKSAGKKTPKLKSAQPESVKRASAKNSKSVKEKKTAPLKKKRPVKQELKKQKPVLPKKENLVSVKALEPVPEAKKEPGKVKKTRTINTDTKLETASWKFFEKNGSVQIKIYTESEAVFSKLARIEGIQKSAKYFVKGRQVAADFIVPLEMAESACSIAGVKIPKITIKKPE